MNLSPLFTSTTASSTTTTTTGKPMPTPSARPTGLSRVRRERAFGVGYGNSSGYASPRRYAQDWMQPRFRCA